MKTRYSIEKKIKILLKDENYWRDMAISNNSHIYHELAEICEKQRKILKWVLLK